MQLIVVEVVASDAAESGKLVIEARGLSKSWGDRPVVNDFSARIARGGADLLSPLPLKDANIRIIE